MSDEATKLASTTPLCYKNTQNLQLLCHCPGGTKFEQTRIGPLFSNQIKTCASPAVVFEIFNFISFFSHLFWKSQYPFILLTLFSSPTKLVPSDMSWCTSLQIVSYIIRLVSLSCIQTDREFKITGSLYHQRWCHLIWVDVLLCR